MINKVNVPPRKADSGWGGLGGALGSIAGMGIGAALAPFTAGTSIPAAAALGGSVGGLAGNMVEGKFGAPGTTSGAPEPAPVQTKKLDIAMKMPEVQMAQMQSAKQDLARSNVPDASKYIATIDKAQMELKNRLGSVG